MRRSEEGEEIEAVADADGEEVNADAVTLSPERFAEMQSAEQFVLDGIEQRLRQALVVV